MIPICLTSMSHVLTLFHHPYETKQLYTISINICVGQIKNAEESDNEDEDSVSKKFRKKKRKGKSDLQKKINTKSPWTGDSGSRYVSYCFFVCIYIYVFK